MNKSFHLASQNMCWEGGSLLHNTIATTPTSFDGYDRLPPIPGFPLGYNNNRGFRIIQNPAAAAFFK
jgi:hypothetical protein